MWSAEVTLIKNSGITQALEWVQGTGTAHTEGKRCSKTGCIHSLLHLPRASRGNGLSWKYCVKFPLSQIHGAFKIKLNIAEISTWCPHVFSNSQRKWRQHYPLIMLNLTSVFIFEMSKKNSRHFQRFWSHLVYLIKQHLLKAWVTAHPCLGVWKAEKVPSLPLCPP